MGNILGRIFTCSKTGIPSKAPPLSTRSSLRCSSCGNFNEEAPALLDKHALKKGSGKRLQDWRDSVCPCCQDDNEQYLTPTQKQLLNRKERQAVGRMEKYIKEEDTYEMNDDMLCILVRLAYSDNSDLEEDAATTFRRLSRSPGFQLQVEMLDIMNHLLLYGRHSIQTAVLTALETYIILGHKSNIETVVESNMFESVVKRLKSDMTDGVFIQACTILSLLATTAKSQRSLYNFDVVPHLLKLITSGRHITVRAEAMGCLACMAESISVLEEMVAVGIVQPLFKVLINAKHCNVNNKLLRCASCILRSLANPDAPWIKDVLTSEPSLLKIIHMMFSFWDYDVSINLHKSLLALSKHSYTKQWIIESKFLKTMASLLLMNENDSCREIGFAALLLYTGDKQCRRMISAPVMDSNPYAVEELIDVITKTRNRKVRLLALQLLEKLSLHKEYVHLFYDHYPFRMFRGTVEHQLRDTSTDMDAPIFATLKNVICNSASLTNTEIQDFEDKKNIFCYIQDKFDRKIKSEEQKNSMEEERRVEEQRRHKQG